FELFADAETLDKDIQKAYQAIQQERK
ncbi:transcriptional regulator, partial [Gardnerella vaginalis]